MAISPFDLTGKTALVTGGARGIGKAIAQAFVGQGATVIIGDVLEAEAAQTAEELRTLQPGCSSIVLDVSSEHAAEAAINDVIKRVGRLDILVNNAGINTSRNRVTIENYMTEEWEKIFAVNVDGIFFVSRPVIKHMKSNGGGRIINISSVLGVVPARLQSAFVASKAAMNNLSKSMAIELAPNDILVNVVAPGSTMTEGLKILYDNKEGGMTADQVKNMLSHIPLARPGNPEEIAAAVVFFAAPASSYVTGTVLAVDGGWTAGYIRDF